MLVIKINTKVIQVGFFFSLITKCSMLKPWNNSKDVGLMQLRLFWSSDSALWGVQERLRVESYAPCDRRFRLVSSLVRNLPLSHILVVELIWVTSGSVSPCGVEVHPGSGSVVYSLVLPSMPCSVNIYEAQLWQRAGCSSHIHVCNKDRKPQEWFCFVTNQVT